MSNRKENLEEFGAARSQLMNVLSEQRTNLADYNAYQTGQSNEDQLMMQAAQVGGFNDTTMGVLNKYGLSQPKVQQSNSTSRNTVSEKNITINNTTENKTVNNIQGSGNGGVNDAKFQTWVSNMTAKQAEQSSRREKEFRKKEWELNRSSNRIMERLEEMNTSLHESSDPERNNKILMGGLKSLLLTLGFGYLMKNWKEVANYFGVGEESKNKGGFMKSPFITSMTTLFLGDNNISKGKNLVDGISSVFVGVGETIANRLGEVFEKFSADRAEAIKGITIPTLSLDDIPKSIEGLGNYLGNLLKAIAGGTKALPSIIGGNIKSNANLDMTSIVNKKDKENSWKKDPIRTDKDNYKNTSEGDIVDKHVQHKLGLIDSPDNLKTTGVGLGRSGALVKNDQYNRYYTNVLRPEDIDDRGVLTSPAAMVTQNSAIADMMRDNKSTEIKSSTIFSGLSNLKRTASNSGSVIIRPEILEMFGNEMKGHSIYAHPIEVKKTEADILREFGYNSTDINSASFNSFLGRTGEAALSPLGSLFPKYALLSGGLRGKKTKGKLEDIVETIMRTHPNQYDIALSYDKGKSEDQKFQSLTTGHFKSFEEEFGKKLRELGFLSEKHEFTFDESNFPAIEAMDKYVRYYKKEFGDKSWHKSQESHLEGINSSPSDYNKAAVSNAIKNHSYLYEVPSTFEDKKRYTIDYLIANGMTDMAATGLVANLIHESSLDEHARSEKDSAGRVAFGLAQWRGSRQDALFKAFGKNPSYKQQLEFILHEYGVKKIDKLGSESFGEYRKGWDAINSARTPEEAALFGLSGFEFPSTDIEVTKAEIDKHNGKGEGSRWLSKRQSTAVEIHGGSNLTDNSSTVTSTVPTFSGTSALLTPNSAYLGSNLETKMSKSELGETSKTMETGINNIAANTQVMCLEIGVLSKQIIALTNAALGSNIPMPPTSSVLNGKIQIPKATSNKSTSNISKS